MNNLILTHKEMFVSAQLGFFSLQQLGTGDNSWKIESIEYLRDEIRASAFQNRYYLSLTPRRSLAG